MHDYDQDNDGRFPDESPVEVLYPRSKQQAASSKQQAASSKSRATASSGRGYQEQL